MLAEWNQMKKLYRGSYIDASCQVWLHFAKQFETTWPIGTKLGSKHLYKVLYKVSPFRSIWPIDMAAKNKSFF
jgi:hypothetical protein